jgi:histone H3/H4
MSRLVKKGIVPPTNVEKVMKADHKGRVSKDAATAGASACESLLIDLAKLAAECAAAKGAKVVTNLHIVEATGRDERFKFLREAASRAEAKPVKKRAAKAPAAGGAAAKKARGGKGKGKAAAAKGAGGGNGDDDDDGDSSAEKRATALAALDAGPEADEDQSFGDF